MADVIQERQRLRKLVVLAQTAGAEGFMGNYHQFRRILLAIKKFSSDKGTPPRFLYDLVAGSYLEPSVLIFTDSERFTYSPRYLATRQQGDEKKVIFVARRANRGGFERDKLWESGGVLREPGGGFRFARGSC